jgi:hypothetical protein
VSGQTSQSEVVNQYLPDSVEMNAANANVNNSSENEEQQTPLDPFDMPKEWLKIIIFIVTFPVRLLFFVTIPDCRRERFKKFPFYFITFLISIIYIGAISYCIVWMIVIIG